MPIVSPRVSQRTHTLATGRPVINHVVNNHRNNNNDNDDDDNNSNGDDDDHSPDSRVLVLFFNRKRAAPYSDRSGAMFCCAYTPYIVLYQCYFIISLYYCVRDIINIIPVVCTTKPKGE